MNILKRFLPICLFTIYFNTSNAQTALLLKEKIGDKYYRNMSYMQAIATYEDIIKEDTSNVRVLPNLAYCYRKISDTYNAERVFAKVVQLDTNNASYVLEYAQLLAINKKYSESALQYDRYNRLNPNDSRAQAFRYLYQTDTVFINKNLKVTLSLSNFNSGQSDFSPAFYQKGLVFVSNRSYATAVKRTFEWDQTPFLDLYYIEDTAEILPYSPPDTSEGKSERKKIYYNDDDTRVTSNDSRTMGYIGYKYVDTSNIFITPSSIVKPFSKKIKTKYHEGPLCFSTDQTKVIFTRNNYNKGRSRQSDDRITKLKLYLASKSNNGKWSGAKPLNINNDNYSIGHPTFGDSDTILYFASDMPGGYGGTDLYKSVFKDGKWSTPENLGKPINTEGNEQFPFYKDGILYFASNGHPGLGGLDIFKTPIATPAIENMGIPLNSSFDDFGIALNKSGALGYISSNRRRGINDDDIYQITLLETKMFNIVIVDSLTGKTIAKSTVLVTDSISGNAPTIDSSTNGSFNAMLWNQTVYNLQASATGYVSKSLFSKADIREPSIIIPLVPTGCVLAGTITEKESNKPIQNARIVIINKQSKDTVFDTRVGEDGKYRFAGIKKDHTYDLFVTKEGYFNKPATQLSTFNSNCSNGQLEYDYLRNFELDPIIIGKAIKIDNIYFDLNKYNIRKDAATELDKIVKMMQDNPDIVIELSSHTDCRSSYQYNLKLSDNRAKSSAAYIVSKGISENRITGKGYGESMLVNDCGCENGKITRVCSEDEHQANRRTEFKVTGFLSDPNTQILNNGQGNAPTSVPVPKN
ncbi:MAG: OmpA family protein [Bacteroidia bacterium]|jgi:outer membrane protein OmpA-like peptidoglycan-associated protein/tetratricopeptide (TPR) repeat protein|nr:OmpA family protein [Bacteroidia bacterium]